MAVHIDPEGNEIEALQRIGDWRGNRVIEIGCGDGRLTLRLAGLGAVVHAIDPHAEAIRMARKNRPKKFARRIRYRVGQAEHLEQREASFDLAVFSWVL